MVTPVQSRSTSCQAHECMPLLKNASLSATLQCSLEEIDDNEQQLAPTQPIDLMFVLKGTFIFVDVRAENENRSKAISRELRQLGASIADKVSGECTHVVFKDGRKCTVAQLKRHPGIRVVSVLWVDACKKTQSHVDEFLFPVKFNENADSPMPIAKLKRVKSLQPKSFEDEVNNSGKKEEKRKKKTLQKMETTPDYILCLDSQEYTKTSDLRKLVATPRVVPDTPWVFNYIRGAEEEDEQEDDAPVQNGGHDSACYDDVNCRLNFDNARCSFDGCSPLQSELPKPSNLTLAPLDRGCSRPVSVVVPDPQPVVIADEKLRMKDGKVADMPLPVCELSRACESVNQNLNSHVAAEVVDGVFRSAITSGERTDARPSKKTRQKVTFDENEIREREETKRSHSTDWKLKAVTGLKPVRGRRTRRSPDLNPQVEPPLQNFHELRDINRNTTIGLPAILPFNPSSQNMNRSCKPAGVLSEVTVSAKRKAEALASPRANGKIGSGSDVCVDAGRMNAGPVSVKKKRRLLSTNSLNGPVENLISPVARSELMPGLQETSARSVHVVDATSEMLEHRQQQQRQSAMAATAHDSPLGSASVRQSPKKVPAILEDAVSSVTPRHAERRGSVVAPCPPSRLVGSKITRVHGPDQVHGVGSSPALEIVGARKTGASLQLANDATESAIVFDDFAPIASMPDASCSMSAACKRDDNFAGSRRLGSRRSSSIDFQAKPCPGKKSKNRSLMASSSLEGCEGSVDGSGSSDPNTTLRRKARAVVGARRKSAKASKLSESHAVGSTVREDVGATPSQLRISPGSVDGGKVEAQDDSGISDSDEICDVEVEHKPGAFVPSHAHGAFPAARFSEHGQKQKRHLKMHGKKPSCSLVTTSLHFSEQDFVDAAVRRLGGFLVKPDVTTDTTHVIAGSARRTVNALKAIVKGCWLVSPKWVSDSFEAGRWLPEGEYEVMVQESHVDKVDQPFAKRLRTSRVRDLLSAQAPIYVADDTLPPAGDLRELVSCCGGKVTSSLSKAGLAIGLAGSRRQGLTVVSEKWLLDSIWKGTLLPTREYEVFARSEREPSPDF